MSRSALALLLVLGSLPLPAQLAHPVVGCVLGRAGRLRPVLGVSGSFTLGEPVAEGVVRTACSERSALFLTEHSLEWMDFDSGVAQVWDGLDDPAVFAFTAGGALVHFAATSEWFLWKSREARRLDVKIAGEVLAIAQPAPGTIVAVVRREGELSLAVSEPGGAVNERKLAGAAAPALLPEGAVLFAFEGGLMLERANGARMSVPLPSAAEELAPMGENWVAIRLEDGRTLALRVTGEDAALYTLPEVEP